LFALPIEKILLLSMSQSGSPAPVAIAVASAPVEASPAVAPAATVTAAPQVALTTSYSLPYTYTYVPAEGGVPQQQYYYSYPAAQDGTFYYQPYYGGYPEVAPATKAVQKKKGCCGGAPAPKAPAAPVFDDITARSMNANIAPVEISKTPSVVPAAATPSAAPAAATPAPLFGDNYGYATSYEVVQAADGSYYYVPVASEPAQKVVKKKSCWC